MKCEYCGNQRSIKSAKQGLIEEDYKDLLNFEKSTRYDDRQKAALAYAEAITWDLQADDAGISVSAAMASLPFAIYSNVL